MEVLAAVVVVATLAAMASGKVPAVLALATGLAVGGILKLAPVPALFAGLSNGGVITVAGVLVIAKGVVRTGVIARVTWRLLATVTTAARNYSRSPSARFGSTFPDAESRCSFPTSRVTTVPSRS